MALWMVRCGRNGEHEARFLQESRVYLTWSGLNDEVCGLKDKPSLRAILERKYPDAPVAKISNYTGQIWQFLNAMQPGDFVVTPSKAKSVIHVGEIASESVYDPQGGEFYRHYRKVNWLREVRRADFDQDMLYSLGAVQTICRIEKNEAEKRLLKILKGGNGRGNGDDPPPSIDLERLGRDEIARLIIRTYKGHGLARLVEAILKAQGYTTYRSPEGPDKGVDILAAQGPLGFESPRICVQVKSTEGPVDSPTLNQLIGAMQNVHAERGLLVSWGGFKSTVEREEAVQFFRVRLWDQDKLIEELLANYDRLDEDLRAELPLKRIWTVASQEQE
jgi:restriction system protein